MKTSATTTPSGVKADLDAERGQQSPIQPFSA
jgi:hypothetical protein